MPDSRSPASRLNHLLFEVVAVAPPQVAYAFVTKNLPTLHTFNPILPMLALPGAYGGLEPLPLRPRGVPWASKRQLVLPVMDVGLGICPHGIRGPLAKTGTHPTGEPASNRHDGALLTPGRRYPVKNFLEHLVTGKSAPGGFDEQVTHATGALATAMATPPSRPRRILARGQPRVAEERPLIGQAGHIAALSRQGPGDHNDQAAISRKYRLLIMRRLAGAITPN